MIFMGVTDFNVLETTGFFRRGFNAYREAGVRPTDGSSATAHLSALRGQVPWNPGTPYLIQRLAVAEFRVVSTKCPVI